MQLDFGFKYCTHCKTEKLLTEFYKQSRNKDGLTNYCISCKKAIYKQNYVRYASKASERGRNYYAQHKEHINKCRKSNRLVESLRDRFYRMIDNNSSIVNPTFNTSGQIIKQSLEQQFEKGMNWNNKQWKIVFIKRLPLFDLNKSKQIHQAFSPENVKPVWKTKTDSSPST